MRLKPLVAASVVAITAMFAPFTSGLTPASAGPNGSVDIGDAARFQGAIALGSYHACVVVNDGTVKCWGYDDKGQVGNGDTTSGSGFYTDPQSVTGLTDVKSVFLSSDTSCALKADGTVWCWGDGTTGTFGIAKSDFSNYSDDCDVTTNADPVLNTLWCHTPIQVSGLSGVTSLSINSGGHNCAIASGVLKCWGANDSGQLGNNTSDDGNTIHHVPTAVTVLGAIIPVEVAAGLQSTCVLDTTSKVSCWGSDTWGNLGVGAGQSASLTPIEVITGVSAIARASSGVYCAIKTTNGELFCWGMNYQGSTGTNTTAGTVVWEPKTTGLTEVVAVYGGWNHACAVLSNGVAKCWGEGGSGQVGNGLSGEPSYWTTPQSVAVLSDGIGVAAITGGDFFSCAISTERNVYCWGDGYFGTLGVEPEALDNCYYVVDSNFYCYISFEIEQLSGLAAPDETPTVTDLPRATGNPEINWGSAPKNDSSMDVVASKPFPESGFGRVVIGKELTLIFSQDAQGRISVKPFIRMKNYVGTIRYSIEIAGQYSCTGKSFGTKKTNNLKTWVSFSPSAAQQCPKISYAKANLVYRGDQPMLITLDHTRLNRATGKAPANNKVRNFEITITSATVNNFPL